MGAGSGCSQLVLVLINLIFSLIGLVLLVVGALVKTGSAVFDSYLEDGYAKFRSAIEAATANSDVDLSELDIGALVGDTAIAFIVIGAFFFLLGIFGCFGAACKSRPLLIIYAVVLAVIVVAEAVCVILFFTIRSDVDKWIKTPLQDAIENEYSGTNGSDIFTQSINFVMHQMECCGIENYTEFATAKAWKAKTANNSTVVPFICCKDPKHTDTSCVQHPNVTNSYIGQGCYEAVNDWLTKEKDVMIGVGSAVAAVQVLLIMFALIICCQARRDEDDDAKSGFDEFPIQPYRETPEAQGHRNMSYEYNEQELRPKQYEYYRGGDYREDQRGQAPPHPYTDPSPYRGHTPSYPYNDHGPYQGRTDRYQEPPEGYRSRDGRRR